MLVVCSDYLEDCVVNSFFAKKISAVLLKIILMMPEFTMMYLIQYVCRLLCSLIQTILEL